MKSKKLISLLCAAALSASSFAGLAVTASAATTDDILWSDTFNNAATGVLLDGTVSVNSATNDTAISGLKFVTTNRGAGDKGCYYDANNNYVLNGSYYAVNEKADATDKYVRMSFPVFGDFETAGRGRWAHVDLGSGYAATADKDVIMDFDLKLNDGLTKGEKSAANPVLRIGSFTEDTENGGTATAVKIDKAAASLGDDWVHARIIVSNSTGAKLYIGGTEVTSVANANVKALNTIGLYSADGASNCGDAMTDLVGNSAYDDGTLNDPAKLTQTPTADIDNVIIYNEAAGVATGTSVAPGAQSQEGGSTPAPVATPVVVPAVDVSLSAPEGVTGLQSYTFDNVATKKWSLGTEDTDDSTHIPGLNIHIGSRSGGGTVDTYAAVTNLSQGNALKLVSNSYATAGRAPRFNFTTGLPVDADNGISTAVTFNVYLSAVEGKEDIAQPRLFLLKDATQSGTDGAGAFRNVAAVLTAVENETIYRGDDQASDVISAYITPNEWHKVTMIISPGSGKNTHRVYIDDDYDQASISVDYVATGENASSMDNLPYFTVESKAAKVGGVDQTPSFGVAYIDNLLAYQGAVDNPKKLLPVVGEAPTPAPPTPTPVPKHTATIAYDKDTKTATITTTETEAFDAVLINAAYDTEGVLASVKSYPITGISNAAAKTQILESGAVTGGKLMLWNTLGDMVPFASLSITDGEAQPTAKPAPTATPEVTEAPTSTPEVTTAPTSTPEVTTAPTSTPEVTTAPTATPVPTYTVSGTVDAGVKEVKLHSSTAADDHTADIPGTIDGTTVTFANVPAGTYTVEATAKTGYKNVVVKVGETATATVTVTDANVTNIAITTSPISTATIGVLTGATNIGDKTAEDLSATLAFAAPTAENTVAVTGTLKYVDSYPAMGSVAQTHYYLPYKISGLNENAVVYVQSKDGSNYTDPETNKTYKKVTSEYFDNAEKTELFGVQAVSAAKNSLTIMVDSDGDGTVYDKTTYTIDISALTLAEPTTAVPYAEGTITYDEESAAASFVDYSRVTSTVADGANGNATKVQNLQSGTGGGSGAGYNPFTEAYPATGDAVKVSFDITIPARNAWVSVRGTKPGTGNRDNAATNRIFTIGGESDDTVKIYSGTNVVDSIENTDIIKKWYHVDAVVNNTTKKTTIKIYNYKANNNYTNETALYDKTVDFRDSTVAGVVAMDYSSNTNNANMQMDNLYINDPTYVEPIVVTATDATVDKAAVLADDVITITPTAKTGQKVTAVKVNGVAITADEGAYKYTVLGTEEAIAVTVEYARADVTAIEISGDAQVSVSARTANYTAVAKADTTPVNGTITWSIAPAETGGAEITGTTAINSSTGVLTLDPTQGAGKIVITASTKKDITSDSAEAANTVTATKEVTLVTEPVYSVTKGTETNGTFTISAETAKKADTITVVPSPAAGYAISEVSYTPDGGSKVVVNDDGGYKITGITANITVNVTFTAIQYTITNATVSGNGNSAAIKIGAEAAATATVGQTVTIVPTAAQGYKVASVAVAKTGEAETTVKVTNNAFTMPAYAVTVTVTFETWDGVYYTEDFETYAIDSAITAWYNGGTSGYAGSSAFVKPDTNTYVNTKVEKVNCVRQTVHKLDEKILTQDGVKLSYDINIPVTDSTYGAEISIGDSSSGNVLSLGSYAGTAFKYYVGGTMATSCGSNGDGLWGNNTNVASGIDTGMTLDTSKWYHVELSVNGGKGTLTITQKDDTSVTTTISDIDISNTDILYIKANVGKLNSSTKTGNIMEINLDNIKITTAWAE
ncbi:MAG: hypothetical protein SOZ28_01510 [Clostridia bacterium]|nr:hypothetical protein [Clostridia bacterium]